MRYVLDLSLMDFASRLGKEKNTVHRWEVGGIDDLLWEGILSRLGYAKDWKPPASVLRDAENEVADLRRAAASRPKTRATASVPRR